MTPGKVTHGRVKIIDMGLARVCTNEGVPHADNYSGTPGYVAPEVMHLFKTGMYYQNADIWSCGVMLFVLWFNYNPWCEGHNVFYKGPLTNVLEVEKQKKSFWDMPESLKQVILKCLDPNPLTRPTASALLQSYPSVE